ncbi:hypothetical protein BDM02DRAFT_3119195 [Thelephora ganbajun]|uniref:Uncharacterized protein n=1 Tax=Thelephora ganbajun TaxID=370292 RepID=A0ACB6Z8P5_THEGA|nr:hypothetical protein BDM02DRAFT_3119195 [Thelephora ganbajun]
MTPPFVFESRENLPVTPGTIVVQGVLSIISLTFLPRRDRFHMCSTSLHFDPVLFHDLIQILPSIKYVPTRIDEIVDVVS